MERKVGHISHYLISPLSEETFFFAVIHYIFASLGPRGSLESKHRLCAAVMPAVDEQDRKQDLHVAIEGLR